MAQSTVQYDVFLNVGEGLKLKFHTRDGGKHLQFVEVAQLPEGVSKAAVDSVLGKVMATLRAETIRIEKAQADSAEQSRQAKAARQAQMIDGEAQAQRTARRNHFLRVADDSKQRAQFDPATMWSTRNRNLALAIASKGTLQFLGNGPDYTYVFADQQHIGGNICPRCVNVSLQRSKPNAGGSTLVSCTNPECTHHDFEHQEVEVRHAVMRGAVARI